MTGIAIGGEEPVAFAVNVWRGPVCFGAVRSVDLPVDFGGQSGITGVAPIEMPAFGNVEEHANTRSAVGR